MNAKDLLTALNDIDPKLLEDVEPWGEPAQPLRRRPLWAVAAGLVLALGLGTGGLLLAQHLSALPAEYQQSQEEGVQQDSAAAQAVVMPELEFESFSSYTDFEESNGLSQALYAYYTDYVGSFFSGESHEGEMPDLTEEQLETIWGAPLPWDGLEDIQLEAYSAQVHDTCLYAEITGRLTTEVGSLPLFSVVLIPQQDAQEWEQLAEECVSLGNNQVQGIDIAAFEVTGTDYYSPQISPEQTSYLASFVLEGNSPVIAHLITRSYTESDAFSKEDAQELLNALVGRSISSGLPVSGLTTAGDTPSQVTLTYAENNTGRAINTDWALPPDSTSLEMTPEEIASLWGGETFAWQGTPAADSFLLEGYRYVTPAGETIRVMVWGYASQEAQDLGMEAFFLILSPEDIPVSGPRDAVAFLEEPNNQVEGVDVWAAKGHGGRGTGDVYHSDTTLYNVTFLTGGVGAAAQAVCDPLGLGDAQAQELLAALVEQSIRGGIHLEGLAQGASAGLELSFPSRPATDNAFSNVWNTFTTLYLEPQNLAAHNAKPDYTLTEEELASLWKGALPWESFLTENDTVEAYGYFSDAGQLIKVYIGGYRDSPEIPGTQAYQLFSIALYNMELTGEWGQAAENALALADTTFQGVDIATQRTESRMDYEDGTSMDFSDYGALFQPEQGPVLISVDGFYSPVAFTRETAQSFVEQVTEEILTHGVDLSGITGAP